MITFFRHSRPTVIVRPGLAEELGRLYRAGSVELCAGIVGRYSDDGSTAICSGLVRPVRGRWFDVDVTDEEAASRTRELERVWKDTGGEIFYLGDWHTHPLAEAAPSVQDRETAMRLAADPATNCPQFVMLISGASGLTCALATRSSFVVLERGAR